MKVDEVRCDFCDKVIERKDRKDGYMFSSADSSYSLELKSKKDRYDFDLCAKCYYKLKKLVMDLMDKKEKKK